MPFFSVGYQDKERVEVTLLGPPADPKSEGYDSIKALVQVDVGAFKGELEIPSRKLMKRCLSCSPTA